MAMPVTFSNKEEASRTWTSPGIGRSEIEVRIEFYWFKMLNDILHVSQKTRKKYCILATTYYYNHSLPQHAQNVSY